MYLLLPLIEGHLPNVAIISWQIVWPYWIGNTVSVVIRCLGTGGSDANLLVPLYLHYS